MKTYGPYSRKDGRKHVIIIHDDGRRQTKSWPRVIMETYLGRELLPEETVDHINEDRTDDSIDNLQILSFKENASKSASLKEKEYFRFICPQCKEESVKHMNQVRSNWKKTKTGPFCSRSCAGKFTYTNPWKGKLS